jgi:hypothetical protein
MGISVLSSISLGMRSQLDIGDQQQQQIGIMAQTNNNDPFNQTQQENRNRGLWSPS